jgi:hypothetical protein
VRRMLIAALLALMLVVGMVSFAAGQVVASFDQDDDHISACVGGTDLSSGPHRRSWSWLDENRGDCDPGWTRIDWPNDPGD